MLQEKAFLPLFGSTPLSHRDFRDRVEFCMTEGKVLLVTGVVESLDPYLDPLLERRTVSRGRRTYVPMGDKLVELHPDFRAFVVTRLRNPNFSPELQAKATVVDFTVTVQGLEEQLLGRVIAKEQKALEDLLTTVLEEVSANTKSLQYLDEMLLNRLSDSSGSLLDDRDVINVLASTKTKAEEVKDKLRRADEARRSISDKRDQYRPVATRGSCLYFAIIDMSIVNCMYQTSLGQVRTVGVGCGRGFGVVLPVTIDLLFVWTRRGRLKVG